MNALLRMFHRAPDFVIGGYDNPYLERRWLIPRNRWFNVYLHHFLRSDDDRALHDHPWINASILLSGSYCEHLPGGIVKVRKNWRPWAPWRVVLRGPTSAHRVQLFQPWTADPDERETPVWTLFITGPRVRNWGFHCPKRWVPWQQFVSTSDSGQVGRGCGEP